jgi:uncharacterized protein (DUF305 family)
MAQLEDATVQPSMSGWKRPLALAVAAVALIGLGVGGTVLAQAGSSAESAPVPGAVDVGFLQDMSVHHAQAIEMGQIVGMTGDTVVAALAQAIRADQLEELGRMQGYLDAWDAPSLPSGPPMTWMPVSPVDGHDTAGIDHIADAGGGAEHTDMPGLATQPQLQRLRDATGRQRDVLFLQLMLRHHQGGVLMADYAAQHANTRQIQELAAGMSVNQTQEIQRIAQILIQDGIDPNTPPA